MQSRSLLGRCVVFTVLLGTLGCRSKTGESAENNARQATPTEIFHLRSECASLTDQLYKDKMGMLEPTREAKAYYWWHNVSQRSNYDARTNRCFAEIRVQTTDRASSGYEAWSTELYDGQTKELLAMTRHQVSPGSLPKEQDTGHILGAVPAGFQDNFRGASDYIQQSMEDPG